MVTLLVFDTTHHALWAEDVARGRGIAVEPVPAPADAGAGCDLALELLEEDLSRLEAALREEGVACRRYGVRPAT